MNWLRGDFDVMTKKGLDPVTGLRARKSTGMVKNIRWRSSRTEGTPLLDVDLDR